MFRQIAPNGVVNKEPKATSAAQERPGNATATGPNAEETRAVHAEMSRMDPARCPVMSNSNGFAR